METQIHDGGAMEPIKVLLRIVHDTLKKRRPTNGDVVRMSELRDDSLSEPQTVKVSVKYEPTVPSPHLHLEISAHTQKKLNLVIDVRPAQDGSAPDGRACTAAELRSGSDASELRPYSDASELRSDSDARAASEHRDDSDARATSEPRPKLDARARHDSDARAASERASAAEARSEFEAEEISRLIHQLIMERFRDELREIKKRMSDRHPILKEKSEEERRDGLPEEEEEPVEYDEKTFLREALGKEDIDFESEDNLLSSYYSNVTDRSIGSNEVSTLLSCGSRHNDDDVATADYSAVVPKSMRGYRSDTLNEYDVYESIDGSTTSTEEDRLIGRIRDEWCVIGQLTNALREYRKRPKVVGEEVLVEAERLLLVATYRRDLLTRRLCREPLQNDNNVLRSTVKVSGLTFFLRDQSTTTTTYYACVLRGGEEVRATMALRADADGTLAFREEFRFEGAARDLDGIELGVYGLVVPKGKELKKPLRDFTPAVPSFRLRSRTTLRPNRSNYTITERDSPFHPHFAATVDHRTTVAVRDRGFLTVAEARDCASATRRWCALDGSTLRYWTRPDEETVGARPVGQIDLSGFEMEEDARPMTVALVGRGTAQRYLLSAETREEYERWRRELGDVVRCFE